MLKLMLVLNCVAALCFVFGRFYIIMWVAAVGAPMRITELDRAHIINEAKLAEWSPQLAENVRHDLGAWVAEKERASAIRAADLGCAVAVTNVIILHVTLRRWRFRKNGATSGMRDD